MEEEKEFELEPLSKRHQKVLDEYLVCFNKTKAYQTAYPSSSYDSARTGAARLFADANFSAHLKAKSEELQMSADEAIKRVTDVARSDVGVFFKVSDEWMFNPLPEYEILDEKEVIDGTVDPPKKRVSYRVRHVILDMDKVRDPAYSWMLKSFSNSRKNGYKIELHDQYDALRDILKLHGKFTDRVDVTSGGEKIELIVKYATDDKPPESTP